MGDNTIVGLATLPTCVAIQSRALLLYADALRASLIRFRRIHALLNIWSKVVECCFNVDVVFGGNFKERYAEFVSKLLALFSGYSPFFFPVTLVSNENFVNTLTCMLLNIWEPSSNVWIRKLAWREVLMLPSQRDPYCEMSVHQWHHKQGVYPSLLCNMPS